MTPIDANLVHKKITVMVENLGALERVSKLDVAEYAKDIFIRKATERMLQELIEAAIDINFHLIIQSGGAPPDDYYQSFVRLGELNIIPFEMATELAPSAGLRNRLVHEYDFIDNAIILKSVNGAHKLYLKYIQAVTEHLG